MRAGLPEKDCLAAIEALKVHEVDLASDLDAICRTAARLFDVPVAFATVIDDTSVWLKGRWGVEALKVPRSSAFCNDTVRLPLDQALVVTDLAEHERYAGYDLVTCAPFARFYAGVPIVLRSGVNIGTFCLLDRRPRPDFGAVEIAQLHDLARSVEAHLNLREARLSEEAQVGQRQHAEALLAAQGDALREVDRTQHLAEMTANFGHWRIDGEQWTITWSEGLARIFGQPMPATGKRDLDDHLGLYVREDRQAVRQRIVDAWAGRDLNADGSYQGGGRVRFPDGEEHHMFVQGIAERDASGAVVSLYGVTLDITDLKRSQHTAEETASLLRTTLENIDQGLLMIGPDERVRVFNDRVREFLLVPDGMLAIGADYGAIRRHLVGSGVLRDPVDPTKPPHVGGLERQPERRLRMRADGRFVEVQAMPLPDGGVVRTYADVTRRLEDERANRESERRFRLLAENTTDIVIWSDLDTTRRYVSPAVKSVLGYTPEELIGTKPTDFVHPDDAAAYGRLLDDLCQGAMANVVTTQRYRHKDGSFVWIEVSFSLTRDEADGPVTGYVASLRDVSDRKRIEKDLRISEERLAMALDSGSDGVWDLDIVTGAVSLTGPWLTILGYGEQDVQPFISAWEPLTHPDDLPRATSLLAETFKGSLPKYECEYRIRTKSGGYVWTLARGKVVARDGAGCALRMVGTHLDITRRKEAEALVAHMAVHDALTGLPNRTLFQDRLAQEMGHTERHGGNFAVLVCDLDRFKTVNDTLGHTAGDTLLRLVAKRLSLVVREGDTVARLGGDEFAIILRQLDQPKQASFIASRMIASIEAPIVLDGRAVNIGISIGIAVASALVPGVTADQIFRNADLALYRAKAEGRNVFRFFEAGMDAQIAERMALEHDLRDAVKRGEFALYYQPIVDLASDRVCGFEALMRWHHPMRGAVSPAEFIPLAEESGLIVRLGAWALNEACRQAASWPRHLRMAVNVSAVQFQKPHKLTQTVVAALASSGLAPDRLELEITESVLMRDAEAIITCLLHLRELGVRIALDDFGTGYSSLAYLRRFPFSKIKIDRAFVREIADPGTAAIVQAVVGLGKRVAADITAEGVETQEQRAHVVATGCTQMQGFLFSKPLPAIEATVIAMASLDVAA